MAESTFRGMHADWVVFSSRSLTEDGNIYDVQYEEVSVRKTMIENAKKIMFLCDESKFSSASPFLQCTLADVDYLISNIEYKDYDKEKFKHLVTL